MEDKKDQLQNEFKNSGLAPPVFEAEDFIPIVDREVLNRYLQGELGEQAANLVKQLISRYETWNKAFSEQLLEKSNHDAQ